MRRILVVTLLTAAIVAVTVPLAFALPSLASSRFQATAGCGCHAGMVQSWSESMHAQALTDPLYRMKLEEGDKATGGILGPFCNACHGPVATMSGELAGLDGSKMSPASADAISCDFCHHVTGTDTPIHNTSQQVSGEPAKRGPISDPAGAPHPTATSKFHETAEFCGACHNVDHPINGMPLEATYTEWKEGPYAAQGIVCQDCHMTPGPGVTKPVPGRAAAMGPRREHVALMTWVGGNAGLGPTVLAEQRLRAAASLELTAPEIAGASKRVPIGVRITNVGAGHYLPTGLTEFRQMWLEVTATDASGKELLKERRDFGTVLADKEGKHPVQLWDAASVHSDDRIPPKGSVEATYALNMPASGEVKVRAALYYRSASEEDAKKAGVEIPTTLMVSSEKSLFPSEADRMGALDEAYRAEVVRVADGLDVLAFSGAFLVLVPGIAFGILRGGKRKA